MLKVKMNKIHFMKYTYLRLYVNAIIFIVTKKTMQIVLMFSFAPFLREAKATSMLGRAYDDNPPWPAVDIFPFWSRYPEKELKRRLAHLSGINPYSE